MKRSIIKIDEEKCDGCGLCVPECAEGAIQIIDGKAKLAGDVLCDGLGACLGHCPQGAITIEEREAEAFVAPPGVRHAAPGTERLAKVVHLNVLGPTKSTCDGGACPGSRSLQFPDAAPERTDGRFVSALTHWPIQLHLLSPQAPQFQGRDLLLAADCVAFAHPDFHARFLDGHALAIACPKLDNDQEIYLEKLTWLIEKAKVKSLTVVTMEVPCCMGLVRLAQEAMVLGSRQLPVKSVVVGIRGEVVDERWVSPP